MDNFISILLSGISILTLFLFIRHIIKGRSNNQKIQIYAIIVPSLIALLVYIYPTVSFISSFFSDDYHVTINGQKVFNSNDTLYLETYDRKLFDSLTFKQIAIDCHGPNWGKSNVANGYYPLNILLENRTESPIIFKNFSLIDVKSYKIETPFIQMYNSENGIDLKNHSEIEVNNLVINYGYTYQNKYFRDSIFLCSTLKPDSSFFLKKPLIIPYEVPLVLNGKLSYSYLSSSGKIVQEPVFKAIIHPISKSYEFSKPHFLYFSTFKSECETAYNLDMIFKEGQQKSLYGLSIEKSENNGNYADNFVFYLRAKNSSTHIFKLKCETTTGVDYISPPIKLIYLIPWNKNDSDSFE